MAIEQTYEPAQAPLLRPCDHPGCLASGDFRAPRSRADLQQFYWFCLDHVRAYNAAWNYYAGMSEAEIEAEIRNDTVWQRPTWPLGSRISARFQPRWQDYGLFDDEQGAPRDPARRRPRTDEEKALAVFDLSPPLTLPGLKARYKELVKQHHPDAHGGDKVSEERLKEINQAYSTLKASYFPGS
jgi:DnaJ domain